MYRSCHYNPVCDDDDVQPADFHHVASVVHDGLLYLYLCVYDDKKEITQG